jgi:hypothetical protein
MLPIHKLLSRIRWDPRFCRGRFALGYFDRFTRGIVVVPFDTIRFPAEAPGTFETGTRRLSCSAYRFIVCGAYTATDASSGNATRRVNSRQLRTSWSIKHR